MDRVELRILYQDGNSSKLRCIVNKWKFQDAMMGEQYLTFTITSETPIDWAVGDFCVFRGETYTLNYVPSVTQKAGTKERQDAYTYENVKFESHQEELTRCIMLDITASTGLYIAALGTNYTGSSKFPLYCGETSVGGDTLTPVCALAAKMQANLDRMYGGANAWKIFVDTTTTFVNAVGDTVLVTHTDDKQLSFDNTTVAQALAEVHNTFDLDYCIRGRNIYIGYNLKNLTSDNDEETFAFGYGKGYPTHDDMNKGLFQIKRMANPQQKIVTRLRALGSTKNMPYRYYNKKYNLSQSLFPTNLQLPDTFETSATKATHNAQRDPSLSHVKGDTNDSYIDKNNNAAACAEGIREDCARWDGSNGDLVEIYPTIEGATYGELRGALVEDQDGNTGNGSFPNYSADERIDKLLAVGYKDGSTLVDDANKGDGILPESGISSTGVVRSADIGQTSLTYGRHNQFAYNGGYYAGKDHTLFTIQGVMPGKYAMAPTIGSTFFGFSLSCYRDGCSADVGFQIIIKQKNQQTGVVTTLATYTSDLVSIQRSDGVKEIELPELPDVVNGANAKVSEIRVTAMSDITVTFRMVMRNVVMPSGFTDDFSISYKVGNSRLDHSVTYEPEYTWFPVDDSDSIVDRFHVFIQDMGFDLEACWSDETPMLVMKSGRCVGREFEILQDIQKVTHNNKKGYMLTLKRAEDSSLNTYYPSQTDPIAADDTFVLLGIQMPEAYVKMAEVRLLRAATQYLADNCETKFTYQPSIDDIYLQRNYDNMVQAGTPNKSIFWRLYAGLKFTFRGVPTSEDSPAPLADITIEKVTISMGEGLTPRVELTLNDDVQQGTIQKLTTSVDRIYNGSIFASGSGNGASGAMSAALLSLLQSEGEKLFLSKTHDDTAAGKITFNDVVTHNETLKAKKGIKVGNFQSRFLGSGALIDEEGNAEFESIYSRNFISTPEFRFNRITVTEGENWCTNGFGTIKEVEIIDDTTGYITLKLEENDYASIETGDICRGIYNDIANQYETASLDDDTELYAGENEGAGYGFSSKEGFFTSYFWVRSFVENKKGECKFMYELRNSNTPHPCAFMKFAQYGSFTNANRRSSSYSTSIGHYYEMVLDGVSTWKIRSANVVYRKGYLGNMTVTLKNGHEAELQGYGLYVQDNVYFGNAIVQLDPETLAEIEESLKSYEVNFSGYVDVITVDDVGNCIGGLWTVSGENNEYRNYRIHSAITVRKSGNLLILAGNNEDAGEGTFKIYAQPIGCTCVIENSTIYITGIDNIKDGVAGSADDANFDYAAMRNMESCSVDIIIDCEGKGSIQKNFPIRIKHDSQPFVGADISNEFSAVSWNTQTQAYVGLPITFDMKMWHNNEILDIASTDNVSLASATGGVTLVNGTAPATPAASSIYYSKSIITDGVTGKKHARISINAMGENLPNVIDIDVTSTATYSGVSYERTLRHTINRSTDTNVYQLHPSVGEVGVIYNDNKEKVISTNKVYTDVRCDSTDDKHYTVATSDYAKHGLFITYQTFTLNASDQEVASAEAAYSTLNGVTVSNTYTRIRFKLYKLVDTTLSPLSALLDSTNVVEVLDIEDVPVILDGLDGDNSISVCLDNQNDAVMCIEDGTVIASTLPVAKARLMDGEETVGRSVLGTTLAANKLTLGNWTLVCHGCTAEFVGWEADANSDDWVSLRVTGVTDDVASVDVKCQYTKHGVVGNYISILTVKKIYGLDKYELTFDPPVISYNPNTNTYTPQSINVYVWKTTQEEDRHLMTSLPGNTSNAVSQTDGSIRLQYSVDKGVTWTTLYGYSSGKSVAKTLYDVAGAESIDFRIQKYVAGESGGEWVLLDEEGVEIVGDGENVIQLIIDNGNDSVVCLEDGTVIASTLPVANVYLYDGNDMVNTSLQAAAWQTLECVGCTASWVSGYQSDGGKKFSVSAVTADVAKVTAKVSYKGNIYQVVHTIKKLYGLDKYEIITDPVSIAYNPNTGAHTPTSFNVYVYLTTQEEDRHLMTTLPKKQVNSDSDGDVRLQYSVNNGNSWTTITNYSSGKTVNSSDFSSVTSGAVLLRVQKYVAGESGGEWVLLDEEGVEITRNGQDGKGVEYIFFAVSDWDGVEAHKPTLLDVAADRQVDNYCPYTDVGHTDQWTDEPTGVSLNYKYEFYAQRKKVNGVWQPFSGVKVWDHFPVDGETPYIIDLSNEQSFVNCDENGNVLSGATYETSRLMLFKGGSYAFTDFNILVTPTNISCNGSTNSFYLTDSQKSTAQSNGYFVLTPSAITSNTAQISIQAQLKTNSSIVLTTTYRINKNISGGVGQDAVMYSLIPSLNVVHKDANGNFIDTALDLAVKKIVGTSVSTIDSIADWDAEGFVLKYSRGSSSTKYLLGSFTNLSTSSLFSTYTRITIYLYNDSEVLLDKESINIVCDGEDGEDGEDASEVNPNILLRTIFDYGIDFVKEKWKSNFNYVYIDQASDTPVDGRKCLRIDASSASSEIDIYQNVLGRVKTGTWYTLSFNYWATGYNHSIWNTFIWSGNDASGKHIIDDSAGCYIDGVFQSSIPVNGRVNWPCSWQGGRHSITFKTRSSFPTGSEVRILFRCPQGEQVAICMPKLEIGQVATAYMAHEDDLPGTYYYLTSDINSIIRTYTGTYRGSATPCVTAWKKVSGKDPQRLYDITDVNGQVAEGFTLNVYEMNGSTKEYTNTSVYGLVTCAAPYSYVDRFEAELVKGGKTYATLSIPIVTEQQGPAGADGVFPRDRGMFKSGETYYYTNQGGVYIRDMVRYEIGGVLYGFLVKTKDTTVTTAPSSSSGDSYWEATGIVETVIANTIFGTNANIGGFMASAEMLRSVTPAYRVKYMGDFKAVSYGLYYQGTFQLGTTYYYAYHGYSVYGAVFYNGSYYKRVGSSAPDTTKTPAEDTSHWTTFASADYDCISHPNTEWLIPSGCTYTYSEASVDAPAIRPMVKYNNKYYVAKGSMLGKTFFNNTFSTTNWREAYDFEVIGIQNVNDTVDVPKFMLNGGTGTLIMRQADDTIYTYDEDGKQTTGYENGRKVVIDPATKSVSVFNDNGNQVITINGENKSSIASAYTGNSGNTSVAAGSVSKGASGSGCLVKANEIKVLSNTFTIGDGGWNFQIQASLSVQASFTTSSSWCPDQDKGVLSYIRPITYYEGSYGHQSYCKAELVLVKEGGSTVVIASATQGANGASYSLSIDKNIHISGGTYYLALRYTYALYSNHSLYITHGAISAAWAKDGYMGEIFANGLAFGNNAQNFFAVIKESDTNLHLKLLSNNKYGLEISSSGVKVCINGTWYTVGVSGGNATLT